MLDEYYKKKQKRKNANENYWSAVYTYYLLEKIDKKTKDTGRFISIMEYLQSLDFIDKDLIDKYLKEGSVQKQKDIAAVRELLYHMEKSPEHMFKLKEVYNSLSKKQNKVLKQVCDENNIATFLKFDKQE